MDYKLLSNYRLDPRKVKVLMIRQGKKNIDFAKLTGIHPVDVSRQINGKGRNFKMQQAIADYLGVPLDSIIQKENGRRPKRAA